MTPRIRERLKSERGQMVLMFAGIFTIMALLAAIVIDFGVWFSERRGAQTDADLVSLAGAYELLDDASTFSDVDGATQDLALANGLDPVDDLHNLEVKSLAFPDDGSDTDSDFCHEAQDTGGRLNAVVLDVDHESRALFASVFGVGAPDIGAHACARAGSLRSAEKNRPWAVPIFQSECFDGGIPQFGQDCIFRLERPSSQVGSIRLGDDPGDPCNEPGGGASKYEENIIEGSDAVCTIGDMIDTEPGLNVGPTLSALFVLLSSEGECDLQNGNLDGIDQFDESFQATSGAVGPDATFAARDCSTPRAIHIVIVDEFSGAGMQTLTIRGFAAFFLQQCEELDGSGAIIEISEQCDLTPGGSSSFQIRGFFLRTVELEGDIGDFDEFGTNAIRLAE